MPKRRAVRCEAYKPDRQQCRCIIRREFGTVRDRAGFALVVLCANHMKQLCRQGEVRLSSGRALIYDEDAADNNPGAFIMSD